MHHYILKPGGCGFNACGQFGISDKRAHAVFFAARADKIDIFGCVIGRKLNYTVFLEQSAKRFILRNASLLEIDYVIGAAVEVARDMGRAENGLALVLRKADEDIKNLIARDGVEPARRLVEDKQIRRMREREGERKFDFHAGRELGYAFAFIKREKLHIFSVERVVPLGIKARSDCRDGAEALLRKVIHAAEHDAQSALDFHLSFDERH